MRIPVIGLLILFALGRMGPASEPAAAGSWVSFRNGLTNPGEAAAALPQDLALLWELSTPDGTASTPVIADGVVYVGTLSGDLHAVELKTGKVIWTYRTAEEVNPKSFPPGFNAPLALDAMRVYAGDDAGTLHAVDRRTGGLVWKIVTDAEIVGGSQVLGDRVIFGSHDGYLYCCLAATGDIRWKVETYGPVNGTPCLSEKYTFTTGCDKPILRVFDLESGTQAAEVPLDHLLTASAAYRDGILYFGTDGGTVVALDWQNGKTLWEFSVPNRDQQIQSSPAVTDEVVVIGTREKQVYCLDRKTGELKWSAATRGRVDGSPVIAGDRVYFGSADKMLYTVSLRSGEVLAREPVKNSVAGSAAVADGYLVIGTEATNGRILCYGAKP